MRKGFLFLGPLAFAAALHVACSSDTRPPNVFNTDPEPDAGGQESEGGMRPFEPIDAAIDAKGCSETTTEILRNPVVIEFAVDESGSMGGTNDKWGAARDALLAAFKDMHDAADPSLFIGVLRWSDNVGNKEAPGPIADATHYDALKTLIDTPSAGGGGTNMQGAMTAAYPPVESFVPPPGFLVDDIRRAVVLVSDGAPNSADQKPFVMNLAEQKLNEPPPKGPILTFSVGIGPFPTTSIGTYDPEFMSWIAVKGGTAPPDCSPTSLNPAGLCHFQITPQGADNTAAKLALIEALKKIRVLSASCEFKFSTTDQTDLNKVTVEITDKDGNKTPVPKDEENGWSFDNPEDPTKILLHGEACSASNGTISGKVEVVLGCKDET